MAGSFSKDPAAVLDYTMDWKKNLAVGDVISSSSWSVSPSVVGGVEIGVDIFTDTTTTVWLSGGVLGQSYIVDNVITTTGGRTDSRKFKITIKDL